jgi:hypothetical protein
MARQIGEIRWHSSPGDAKTDRVEERQVGWAGVV